jgi:hypothetical protein
MARRDPEYPLVSNSYEVTGRDKAGNVIFRLAGGGGFNRGAWRSSRETFDKIRIFHQPTIQA